MALLCDSESLLQIDKRKTTGAMKLLNQSNLQGINSLRSVVLRSLTVYVLFQGRFGTSFRLSAARND